MQLVASSIASGVVLPSMKTLAWWRLTHYLVKAPYSVYRNRHLLYFLSGQKFPRNRRFLSFCAKTGSAGADRFRGKIMCPSSIQRYMCESDRTSGLDGKSTSLSFFFFFFFFSFCPHGFCSRLELQFFRYRDETLQAHCPRGGIVTLKKILGRTPWGEIFFPKFCTRFRSENCGE